MQRHVTLAVLPDDLGDSAVDVRAGHLELGPGFEDAGGVGPGGGSFGLELFVAEIREAAVTGVVHS
jgi:hypothetical protein